MSSLEIKVKMYASLTFWLWLLLICICGAQSDDVETRSIPVQVANTNQQGPGYNARVSIYHNNPALLQKQRMYDQSHQHRRNRPHATFESVVDRITKGLKARRKLPHELEKEQAELNAKGLEQIQNETLVQSKRQRQGQFRRQRKFRKHNHGRNQRLRQRKLRHAHPQNIQRQPNVPQNFQPPQQRQLYRGPQTQQRYRQSRMRQFNGKWRKNLV